MSITLAGDDRSGTSRQHRHRRPASALNARIPLYQGGLPAARIRQAQALEGQLLEQVVAHRARGGRPTPASAFATYQAAQRGDRSPTRSRSRPTSSRSKAPAPSSSVGTRTVLDVLNAEQELLNSQVALVTAERDAYVAGFQLLNAMGQAEADDLGLDGGPLYDPLGNYRRVAGNWNDWASDPAPPRRSRPAPSTPERPRRTVPQGVTPPPQ